MIIVGLLLLIVAAAFGIDFVWKNNVHISNPSVFGERLGIHSAAALFGIGAMTGAVIALGILLLLWGIRRKGAHARGRRRERAETRRLRAERDQRAEQTPPVTWKDEPVQPEPDQPAPEARPVAAAAGERGTERAGLDRTEGTDLDPTDRSHHTEPAEPAEPADTEQAHQA